MSTERSSFPSRRQPGCPWSGDPLVSSDGSFVRSFVRRSLRPAASLVGWLVRSSIFLPPFSLLALLPTQSTSAAAAAGRPRHGVCNPFTPRSLFPFVGWLVRSFVLLLLLLITYGLKGCLLGPLLALSLSKPAGRQAGRRTAALPSVGPLVQAS